MPEHDTYKAIERYAKSNNDPAAALGYLFLKRRTERAILWEARQSGTDLGTALREYLGVKALPTGNKLPDMSEQDRLKMYMEACRSMGIKLDPDAFKK